MARTVRLGMFIVGSLLVLGAGIFLIGGKQLRFRTTYRVMARFPNVAGLQAGADVRVGGTHQGTVKRIDLPHQSDGQVSVVMDVEQGTRDIVNKGSVASIQSEGLLGDKYVEISFGEKGAPALTDGDTLRSETPIDIADLIKKANNILGTADDAMQNVQSTTLNLQAVTSKINAGTGTVGALINDRKVYQQASAGVTAFQENMEALKHNFLLRGFFKERGYEDAVELGKHRISKLPLGPSLCDFVYDASKIFARDNSAKLRNQKTMDDAGRFLQSNRFGLAVVAASSGEMGDTDKSRALSEARAMVIRKYLAEHFRIDDTRVKTLAIGKTDRPGDKAKVEIIGYPAEHVDR